MGIPKGPRMHVPSNYSDRTNISPYSCELVMVGCSCPKRHGSQVHVSITQTNTLHYSIFEYQARFSPSQRRPEVRHNQIITRRVCAYRSHSSPDLTPSHARGFLTPRSLISSTPLKSVNWRHHSPNESNMSRNSSSLGRRMLRHYELQLQ
ncbi:hypothetical protein AG1IA_04871 [Rhizoctonia solani AG-1 IA]|uniref:Uncharacterized protein n=1 Tax=Thanatephorus cucumeris (strain AG1-IA) TaxID=983506 RepID=L8WWE0_THACA|nr:hypothetical protein AG1IA_04871 [Rhizoctonia solani AG-1 IA]